MKLKGIIIGLVLTLAVSLCACGNKTAEKNSSTDNNTMREDMQNAADDMQNAANDTMDNMQNAVDDMMGGKDTNNNNK